MSECALETGENYRSLVNPRSFDVIRNKAYDGRAPVVSIQTHIHTPFLHSLVVYDIWCPLVACHPICLSIRIFSTLPSVGIEVAELHGFSLTVLHLGDEMRSISIGIVYQGTLFVGKETVHIASSFLTSLECCPFLVVACRSGLASTQMRTIYIIGRRVRVGDVIHHDRRVVAGDTLIICSRRISIRQVIVADLSLGSCTDGSKPQHGE